MKSDLELWTFERFTKEVVDTGLHINFLKYSDWHYCLDGRFDVYLKKDGEEKWYDRKGVYGTQYDFEELLHIIKNGPQDLVKSESGFFARPTIKKYVEKNEPEIEIEEPKPRRFLYEIVDDLENLLEELKEHL